MEEHVGKSEYQLRQRLVENDHLLVSGTFSRTVDAYMARDVLFTAGHNQAAVHNFVAAGRRSERPFEIRAPLPPEILTLVVARARRDPAPIGVVPARTIIGRIVLHRNRKGFELRTLYPSPTPYEPDEGAVRPMLTPEDAETGPRPLKLRDLLRPDLAERLV